MAHRSPTLPIAAFVVVALCVLGLALLRAPQGEGPVVVAPQSDSAPAVVLHGDAMAEWMGEGAELANLGTAESTENTRAAADAAPSTVWLRGFVHRSDKFQPVGGVRIAVLPRHGPNVGRAEPVAYGTTAADGRFEFPASLAPAHWRLGHGPLGGSLVAEHPGFATAHCNFDLGAASPTGCGLLLEPAAVLSGRLLDPRGEPLADAQVLCGWLVWSEGKGAPKGRVLPSATTDSRGRFRLAFVRTGAELLAPEDVQLALRVEHSALGHGHHPLPRTTASDLRAGVGERDVELGDVVFPLPQGDRLYQESLRDPEGQPLVGMEFEISGGSGRTFVRRVRSDHMGRIAWSAPAAAQLVLRPVDRLPGVLPVLPELYVALHGADGTSGPVDGAWPIPRLRVRMVDATGLPIEGASIVIDDRAARSAPMGSGLRSTTTGPDGWTADMTVVPGTRATVIGTRPLGGIAHRELLFPKVPHLTVLELRLEPELGAPVRVHTGAPLGKAPNGVALRVVDARSGKVLNAGARATTPTLMELRLPVGSYRLEVERAPPWLLPPRAGVPFDVVDGAPVDVHVPLVRAALLVLVAMDTDALVALRQTVHVAGGPEHAPEAPALRAPRVGADSLVPRFTSAPRGGGLPQMAHPVALRLEPGRWALRWRQGHGQSARHIWIGEVDLAEGIPARLDLGAPAEPLLGRSLALELEKR